MSLQKAVDLAAWTHNTNISVLGYEPMRLVTGKSVNLPGIAVGSDATESLFDSEAIQKIMERHHDFIRQPLNCWCFFWCYSFRVFLCSGDIRVTDDS